MNEPSSTQSSCRTCGRLLEIAVDPLSTDCGGDCWGCIGLIEAQMGGTPEDNISVGLVAREIVWGWREPDGGPRTQSYFLDGGPRHIRVRWIHSSTDDPTELWSELDDRRHEVRKIEIWRDGRVGYASGDLEVGGTELGECAVPPLDEIAADSQFEPVAISRSDFEKCWAAHVR